MTPPSTDAAVQRLLEHADWIRALARKLASDPATADEVEQRTWLAALEHPAHDARRTRNWLAAVMRNFARQIRRGESRRREHEQHAARDERLPSAGELVERAAVQREVVEAVLTLDEPYRNTILLRYFEGLEPNAIAKHRGVPLETVRTHLKRGVALLRVKLDASHGGDRAAWIVALAPLSTFAPHAATAQSTSHAPRLATHTARGARHATHAAPSVAQATLGTMLMNAQLKLLVGALVVAGLFSAWYLRQGDAPRATTSVAAAAPEDALAASTTTASKSASTMSEPVVPSTSAGSQRALATHAAAPEPVVATPTPALLHGQVLDARAAPAANVELGLDAGHAPIERVAQSGADGRFELEPPAESGRIVALDPKLATVFAGVCSSSATSAEPVVVVARAAASAGRVVDETGAPLEHAEIYVDLPADYRTRFSRVMDYAVEITRGAQSDAHGRFRIDSVPLVDGAQLVATLEGFERFAAPVAEMNGEELVITLARPRARDDVVRGIVLDGGGSPVRDAHVALGIDATSTDAQGAFAFRLADPSSSNARFHVTPTTLIAVKRGHQAAEFHAPLANGKPAWPASIVLHLGDVPLAIEGRVVDHKEKPMAGAKVWLADATFFGQVGGGPAHVESMLAGDEKSFWHFVKSDGDGRFRIEGLLARDYHVRAMDPATLLRVEDGPFAAGSSNVELRLPTDTLYPRVAGRIVSHAKKPIAHVSVSPMCDAFQARFQGEIIGTSHDALDGTTTDEHGRFELVNVPRTLVYLRVEGEDILPLEYGRWVEGDARFANGIKELPKDKIEDLEITVDRRCHFQVELADPTSADELAVLDASGNALTINVFVGNGRSENERAPIIGGRSHSMAVSDTGTTLVVYQAGKEVLRRPLTLVPGELAKLEL